MCVINAQFSKQRLPSLTISDVSDDNLSLINISTKMLSF